MVTIEKLLDKAAKLKSLAEGGATEGEMQAAELALQRLVSKHHLAIKDVDAARMKSMIRSIDYKITYKTMPTWLVTLANGVAMAFDCRFMWTHWKGRPITLKFIGEEVDAQVAEYFFDYLYYYLWKLGTLEARERGRMGADLNAFRASYIAGASKVIRERLREGREVKTEENAASTALVPVKDAALDAWFKQNEPNVSRVQSGSVGYDGFHEGRAAGETVPLNKPIRETTNGSQKRLS